MLWHQVPGWFDFQDIYDNAVKKASSTSHFVELGVAFGRSAIYMAAGIKASGKPIRFDAIDTWKPENWPQVMRHQNIFADGQKFRELAAKHGGLQQAFEWYAKECGVLDFINIIQSDQIEASTSYSPASLDLVFLDTCHTEQGTRDAITAWLPKIKPGGTFAGHDFVDHWPGVVKAVKALLPGAKKQRSSFIWQVPV